MKKHKNKIITGVVISILLAFFYWYGSDSPGLHGWTPSPKNTKSTTQSYEPTAEDIKEASKSISNIPIKNETATEENKPQKPDGTPMTPAEKLAMAEKISENVPAYEENTPESGEPIPTVNEAVQPPLKDTSAVSPSPESSAPPEPLPPSGEKNEIPEAKNDDKSHSEEKEMVVNSFTEKDRYITEQVPEGKPVPVEPQDAVISDKELTCTLSIRCDTILENIAWFDKEKLDIVPENGIIYSEQTVTFYEGESVFNLLLREMKKNRIHMEFENTPIYNSAYIEGIANLYEFDCGELSGWMYKVNGWFPNYGCSRYQLKEGDKIEWVYTCDLGVDVGGYYSQQNPNRE